jgi:sensor histidine kinase YesM
MPVWLKTPVYRAKTAACRANITIQRYAYCIVLKYYFWCSSVTALPNHNTAKKTVHTGPALPVFTLPAFFHRRWFYHPVFWVLYYTTFSLLVVYGVYQVRDVVFYIQLIPIYALDTLLIYFNFYWLVPRLLARKKYLYYGVAVALSIVCVAMINILLRRAYAQHGSLLFVLTSGFNFTNIMAIIIERFYAMLLTGVIKIAKVAWEDQQRMQQREKQFLAAELNFLKSQIQPHFFFNTLNNLYSLTLKKSDEAPEVVLKLSELMSYMLYETNAPTVSLDKEIQYLQNYIGLEKLRFGKNLSITFTVEGQTEGVYLPPLVLILFIENSFKHGARTTLNELWIDISLCIKDVFLYFTVKNPFTETEAPKAQSGIGLKNAHRRLDLLYNGNYTLQQLKNGKVYTVSLKIPV